jgi:23S rRNA (cytidine1920-2'-O)/16S rRNA (cytidine1409-2'-O)-methyltransferase
MSHRSSKKIRIDTLLVSRCLVESREKARALILGGKVVVNGTITGKAGTLVAPDSSVEVLKAMPYVSRGGEKLEAALKEFSINVRDKIAMDVGASTGGFTDCLLQSGAKMVYAVDVGYGQLAWELRNNPKVILFEKTNIRYLKREIIRSTIDIITIDVSFISLLKVIPAVLDFLSPEGIIVALIKPQFEVARKDVGKGGVVKDEIKRRAVIHNIARNVTEMGLNVKGEIRSPLVGPKGNVEYFICIYAPFH